MKVEIIKTFVLKSHASVDQVVIYSQIEIHILFS